MAHGRPRITEDPPIRVTVGDQEQADVAEHLLAEYRLTLAEDRRALFDRFTLVDMVRQVVGVGSVGMRVYLGPAGLRLSVPAGRAARHRELARRP